MSLSRVLALLLVATWSVSVARADDTPFRAPRGTVSLSGGFAARSSSLGVSARFGQVTKTSLSGVSPTVLRLRADFFFLDWLGVELDGATDLFTNTQTLEPGSTATPFTARSVRADARVALAARWVSASGFVLSGALGYGFSFAPVVLSSALGTSAQDYRGLFTHGPALRVGAAFFKDRFEASAAVTVLPGLLGAGITTLEPQLFVGWRVLQLDTLALTVGADYGALLEPFHPLYQGTAHRLALGLKLSLLPPPAPVASGPRQTGLRVQVRRPDGTPATGASVSIDKATAVSVDAQGELVENPAPGVHAVTASLAGFRTASATTQVPEGLETVLVLRLEALTGPGRLSGVVQAVASAKPVADALVTAGQGEPTRTDAQGRYRFAAVGPGPVKVRVEAQGFNPSEEVVQVPPEGDATLDVALEALGKGSPATVRGLVRSTTGEPLKATVVIKGLATKVPVNAEGRFVVTVPGGQYFFVITAPGYVPQTKKVVLADGDQAIFHCELQKVTK